MTNDHNTVTCSPSCQHEGRRVHIDKILVCIDERLRNCRLTSSNKRKVIKNFLRNSQEGLVTNLSTRILSQAETEVLNLGLTFTPSPHPRYGTKLSTCSTDFFNRMNATLFFQENSIQRNLKHPFHVKSNWIPPSPKNKIIKKFQQDVAAFASKLDNESSRPRSRTNFPKRLLLALKQLRHDYSVTIKPADKGNGIVVFDTKDYITKARIHLYDTKTYKRVSYDHTQELSQDIRLLIKHLQIHHIIDDKTANFLSPIDEPRTSLFYFLPKLHKEGIPPRPIISGCDSPTANLSHFMTYILQPLAENLPTYIRDTKHFLNTLEKIPSLPAGALLVTADVTSLYTNIPHEEGIEACLKSIKENCSLLPNFTPPPSTLRILMEFILKNNYFQFLDEYFHQILGTAMGTRMAPPYANLFMGTIERLIIDNSPVPIKLWLRYIDDIFLILENGERSLPILKQHMNNAHPTIKFTFSSSTQEIAFLDTKLYLDNNRHIQSRIHTKPTDKHMLLHHDSHHPESCKAGMIYSQGIRYNLINSRDDTLQLDINKLKRIFFARGYPEEVIDSQLTKAMTVSRHTLLHKAPKANNNTPILPLILPFREDSKQLSKFTKDLWNEIDASNIGPWERPPITAYTRGKNLKDTLVHTRQHASSRIVCVRVPHNNDLRYHVS